MGVDPAIVNMFQKLMTEEFEANGRLISEDDPAKDKRKLLGVMLNGETNEVRPPEQFLKEIAYISKSLRVKVWESDNLMGKCAWLFPMHRRFVSIIYYGYQRCS